MTRRIQLFGAVLGVMLTGFSASSGQVSGVSGAVVQKAMPLMQAGNFEEARKLLLDGVHSFPNDAELWNLLGIAESEAHHPQQARTAFARGLQIEPGSTSLNENLGFLLYRESDYTNAKKYLARAVALGSDKPGVRFSLAAARLRTGQEREALDELRQLEEPLRNVGDYWQERGRAELALDPSAAAISFDRALALAPNNAAILNGAAAAAEKQGLDEKALALLVRARSVSPDDVPTLLHFAMVCLRRDLGPDALDALERAQRLQPANNAALYLLARTHIALQNWQQAYDLFCKFSKRVPGYAPAYYAMGWLDIRLNRPDEARKQIEHSLMLAPSLAEARYELAQLDLDEGQLDEAEKLLNNVLRQNPAHAKANAAMGDLLMRRGRFDQAQMFLDRAVRDDPGFAAAHYKLSMLFFRMHNQEKGQAEKSVAERLVAEANRASKVQLRLVLPESIEQPKRPN